MSPEGFGDQDAETPWHLMSARFNLMGHACLGRISDSRQRLIRVPRLAVTTCNKEQINEHGA